jgi:uncharacterized membrane protein YfcA
MPIEWLLYPLLGVAAGLLAGLLGVGGGLVLVAALVLLLPAQGVATDKLMQAALATSLASIIVTATASAWAHHRRGSVDWPSFRWLAPGLVAGAWAGSELATRLDGQLLRVGVAAYCLLAGLQLLTDWPRTSAPRPPLPASAGLGLAGLCIGVVSALVGIGGGSMSVPVLIWRGQPAVRAVGTSSACGVLIGLAAAGGFGLRAHVEGMPPASLGYVFLPASIGVAITSVLAAPYGAAWAHRLPARTLKRVFAAFLVLMALLLL